MRRIAAVITIAMLLSGCGFGVQPPLYAFPPNDDYPISLTAWPPVRLTVSDGRPLPSQFQPARVADALIGVDSPQEHSTKVVGAVQRAFLSALGPAAVSKSPLRLEVNVIDYHAQFSRTLFTARHTGTATIRADLYRDGVHVRSWTGDGTATRSNWLGADNGIAAAKEAFRDALRNLLRQLAAESPSQ